MGCHSEFTPYWEVVAEFFSFQIGCLEWVKASSYCFLSLSCILGLIHRHKGNWFLQTWSARAWLWMDFNPVTQRLLNRRFHAPPVCFFHAIRINIEGPFLAKPRESGLRNSHSNGVRLLEPNTFQIPACTHLLLLCLSKSSYMLLAPGNIESLRKETFHFF